jgi:hypothetical protein
MAIRGGYAPPGVYTETVFESPTPQNNFSGRIPLLIGSGTETFAQNGLSLVRGSSSTIDQQMVEEDATGRVVLSQNPNSTYNLGAFDGTTAQVRTRQFPIVTGDGTGTTTKTASSVSATINGSAVVVLSVNGKDGLVTLSQAPKEGDDVRLTYFFNRTDVLVDSEDVSDQVSDDLSELYGAAGTMEIRDLSRNFIITVDGTVGIIELTVKGDVTREEHLNVIIAKINASSIGTLVASTYVDHKGSTNLKLVADGSIKIGAGSSNEVLGVFNTQKGSERNSVFYSDQAPIVDGTNGGKATSEVSDVTVTVDLVPVTPTSLDPTTGAITLSVPPKVGQKVAISYYFNSFVDNFDYLPARDVVSVDRVAIAPEDTVGPAGIFSVGESWVLKDDKLYWGTFAVASSGLVQNGDVSFGTTQITTSLRDERVYLSECSAFVDNTGKILPNVFKLAHQPTDGTGTGTSTYNSTKVIVRIGWTISDALANDVAEVVRVNPSNSTVTLSQPVPYGQKVFATFYYNNIQDQYSLASGGYDLTVASVGGSNVGTYTVSKANLPLYGATFEGKGTDLSLTTLNFPSGAETRSDAVLGSGKAVEEDITVQIENFEATPAMFFTPNPAPYVFIQGESDTIKITVDNNAEQSVLLTDPSGISNGRGLLTYHVSEPLPYTASSDNTDLGSINGNIFLKIDNVDITVSTGAIATATATEIAVKINTDVNGVDAKYYAMTSMSALTIDTLKHDQLEWSYYGDVNGASSTTITLDQGNYANATAIAAQIQTRIDWQNLDYDLNVSAEDQFLVFSLASVSAGDTYAYIEFLTHMFDEDTNVNTPDTRGRDFSLIAGIDTDVANGVQTKFGLLPVAFAVSTDIDGAGSTSVKDRLILRNRTRMGENYHPPIQLGIEIIGGSILPECGLSTTEVKAVRTAVVEAPTLLIKAGWSDQSDTTGSPKVTFYNGDNTSFDQNNTLNLNISGVSKSVTFTAAADGTGTDLIIDGAVDAVTVLKQLETALSGVATVSIEGSNLRIVSASKTEDDFITVEAGTANALLGLTEDFTTVSTLVSAEALSSAFMQNAPSTETLLLVALPFTHAGASYSNTAISFVEKDATGKSYVGFESLTVGLSSSLTFGNGNAVSTHTTRLGINNGSTSWGEAPYQGFFVTSSNSAGTGSSNTSTLNDGTGVDGAVGQTYIDSVTGFSFTLLPRAGGQAYSTGSNSTLSFKVSKTLTTNANIPVTTVAGVSLTVANTVGTQIGDTALVETFHHLGNEPSLGEPYYVNITRKKSAFNTGVFTRLADVTASFGPVSTENPLSLGAYFAFLNGASTIALKQISLSDSQTEPTVAQMIQALKDVEGEISPGLSPSVIVPLIPASSELLADVSLHCDLQSSLRFRAERTAILGVPAGTSPAQVATLARNVKNTRVRLIYPDIVSITLTNNVGASVNTIVDSRYLAVAMACATTSATIDEATPWTNRTIVGFNGLLRTLDAVDANQTASAGVTILQQQGSVLNVRQGLTTDVSSILTKTPTVIQIADSVHLRARNLLNGYIGEKYLPSIVGQIEGRVNQMFKDLVKEQIIDSYTGLSVSRDPEDPTGLLVEVFYKPIFPLLYIQFTFNLRSSIDA